MGDGCTDHTGGTVQSFADARIRWENLASRGEYPSDPHQRWMVAGTPAVNRGYELAQGEWIADLDDDDEFTPNHIKDLVEFGEATGSDIVYGQAQSPDGKSKNGKLPLMCSHQTRGSVMHRRIHNLRYDINAWKINEPGDWNFLRRARDLGLKISFLPAVVLIHYPERRRLGQ